MSGVSSTISTCGAGEVRPGCLRSPRRARRTRRARAAAARPVNVEPSSRPCGFGGDPAAVQLDQAASPAPGRCRGRPRGASSPHRPAGTCRTPAAGTPARCRGRCRRPRAAPRSPSRDSRTVTEPPRGVNFIALLSRFQTICSTRTGSASIRTGVGQAFGVQPHALAARLGAAPRRCMAGSPRRAAAARGCSASLPVLVRDRSSRSSMICAWLCTVRRIVAAARCTAGDVLRLGQPHQQLGVDVGSGSAGSSARATSPPGTRSFSSLSRIASARRPAPPCSRARVALLRGGLLGAVAAILA